MRDLIWTLAVISPAAIMAAVAFHWWVLDVTWWPLVGSEWRAERRKYVLPAWTGPGSPQTPVPVDDPADDQPATDDDVWVGELHEINKLGKFGDLTRPIRDLTHYEVEAVIRQLCVPEWVPERWRVAA